MHILKLKVLKTKKVKSLLIVKGLLLHFEYGNVTLTIQEMTKILLQF